MSFDFYRLKNGVRVILAPMDGVESVAVGTFIETGSRYETPKINGLSHFLEHMVFKGTKKFPSHQHTSYLEGLGGLQNAWTDVDSTAYWCKLPADRWKEGLELVTDLALNPLFPKKDLEIERGVILEEINRRDDRPDELVSEVLQTLMYQDNPLGQTILGDSKVIKSIPREEFVAYHKRQYVAGRLVVALAGKINASAIKKAILEWYGDLPAKSGDDFQPYAENQTQPEITIKSKSLTGQAHIELGFRGVTISDPRRFGLSILSSYLGQGLSSRLFTELREKRGLCYAVHTDEARWSDTGIWGIYSGLNIEKLDQAIAAILAEVARVKSEKLTDKELVAAKEKVRGPLLFSMENPIHQLNFYAKQALDRPDDILDHKQVIAKITQVESGEVLKIAQQLFSTSKLNLAVVGQLKATDKSKLLKLLKV